MPSLTQEKRTERSVLRESRTNRKGHQDTRHEIKSIDHLSLAGPLLQLPKRMSGSHCEVTCMVSSPFSTQGLRWHQAPHVLQSQSSSSLDFFLEGCSLVAIWLVFSQGSSPRRPKRVEREACFHQGAFVFSGSPSGKHALFY